MWHEKFPPSCLSRKSFTRHWWPWCAARFCIWPFGWCSRPEPPSKAHGASGFNLTGVCDTLFIPGDLVIPVWLHAAIPAGDALQGMVTSFWDKFGFQRTGCDVVLRPGLKPSVRATAANSTLSLTAVFVTLKREEISRLWYRLRLED